MESPKRPPGFCSKRPECPESEQAAPRIRRRGAALCAAMLHAQWASANPSPEGSGACRDSELPRAAGAGTF
eukprot:CAMPEP_0170404202 /NCGR_PEP_ID=MMETSP0117_2-20130122/26506_1 /TAXON_ID=400756 /ORGANISM="Durinskia baltica, Strain CSIRO CS-38" /LENGTH=70 /DNA_ID=CAMNT_0010661203 /DNA_START=1 /DNA_END=213 /DNA_ORIENTATION=+